MAKLVLILVLVIGVLVVSRRIRSVVFHVRVRQFFIIVLFVCLVLALSGFGYLAWKYWWPLYMKQPTVQWTDTTLEHDESPVTPGAGGPSTPTEIQVR